MTVEPGDGAERDPPRRARHRHRHPRRPGAQAVRGVQPARLVDHPQVRRHRPRPRRQQAPRRADGRHDVGRERRGRGRHVPLHDRGRARRRAVAARPPPGSRRELTGKSRARGRRQRDQPPHPRPADRGLGAALPVVRVGGRRARRSSRAASTFDLAILDMHMPGMDGLELARRLHDAAPRPPARAVHLARRRRGRRPDLRRGARQAGEAVAAVRHARVGAHRRRRRRAVDGTSTGADRPSQARRAPSAADPARRGQHGEPADRAAGARIDGLPRRRRLERRRGRRGGRAVPVRPRADGRADARDGRPRGDPPDPGPPDPAERGVSRSGSSP